jgi:hypothetical protein
MTVAEMLSRMSSTEFTEWLAFERINGPLGGKRFDYLAAQQALLTAAAASGKKGKKLRFQDFLFKWSKQRPDARELLKKFRGILPG